MKETNPYKGIKRVVCNVWRAIVPYYIRKRWFYLHTFHGPQHEREMRERALRVGEMSNQRPIRVLFVATNLPMWRCQGIFDLLNADPRFDARIVITSFSYYTKQQSETQRVPLKRYFDCKGIKTVSTLDENFNVDNWIADFNPDIFFPCQQYDKIHGNILNPENHYHRLMIFVPYGTPTMEEEFAYNMLFHNKVWRVYHSTRAHLDTARKLMFNNASNVRICGEPDYDLLMQSTNDPWKQIDDGRKRKKIIWAPHFSLVDNGLMHRASFRWLADEMFRLAEKYADKVQIAFKPHPNLRNKLESLDEYGKEYADSYYAKWNSLFNTQLEENGFMDLFRTSDALIHDCGSFTGEYMMVGKPALFTTHHAGPLRKSADKFGKMCLKNHYFGGNVEDVERFIKEVVIEGNDPLKHSRNQLLKDYITPPNNRSTAENIYRDMLEGLGLTLTHKSLT